MGGDWCIRGVFAATEAENKPYSYLVQRSESLKKSAEQVSAGLLIHCKLYLGPWAWILDGLWHGQFNDLVFRRKWDYQKSPGILFKV